MTSRLPSLNGLRAFEAAARHLSFTDAAAELNVTQTAISHQVRRLEEQLGLRLATDRLLRPDGKTVLTVSCLPSLAAKWLVPRLAAFQQGHPDIEVRIATSMHVVD